MLGEWIFGYSDDSENTSEDDQFPESSSDDEGDVPVLHTSECSGDPVDIKNMETVLWMLPEMLDAKQWTNLPHCKMMLSPLEDAALMAHPTCVEFLLRSGADLNKEEKNITLPTEIFQPLNTPEYTTRNKKKRGFSALELAWHSQFMSTNINADNAIKIMKLLFKYGVDPDDTSIPNKILLSALLIAAIEKGKADIVQLFLINNAVPEDMIVTQDYTLLPFNGCSLSLALTAFRIECYKLLLFYGARLRNHFVPRHHELNDVPPCLRSVPHYIIECSDHRSSRIKPTTKDIVEALEVFQNFGGNMWTKEIETLPSYESRLNENALEYLIRRQDLCHQFPGLAPKLEEMMSTPCSLKNICRVSIRKAMGRKMWKHIRELEVPAELKEFLLFGVKKVDDN